MIIPSLGAVVFILVIYSQYLLSSTHPAINFGQIQREAKLCCPEQNAKYLGVMKISTLILILTNTGETK